MTHGHTAAGWLDKGGAPALLDGPPLALPESSHVTAPTAPAVHELCRSSDSRACVLGMGVAPPSEFGGKLPPSSWSWSSVKKNTMLGRVALEEG